MSMSVNNVLSNYTYTYQSKLRPILDRDYDSIWSKDEVAQYAADYKAATGTELDVDAIFNQYDVDGSGSLEFAEYESAADSDAFGLSLLSQKQAEASSVLGNSSNAAGNATAPSGNAQSPSIQSSATLNDVLSNYTYSLKGDLHVILDQDYDGVWSQDEISQYAADYKSATGTELDIDAIMKQYDTDSSGSLEFSEYEAAAVDDAFGAALLSQKKSEAADSAAGNTTAPSGNASSGAQSSNITSTATLNDVIADYTYNYQGERRVILDQDYDGVWSQDEVAQYAADYKSATGTQLDTEAIFKQYDADGNHKLEYGEYEAAMANDAFGVSQLSQKYAESASSLGTSPDSILGSLNGIQSSGTTDSTDKTTSSTANMSDWLQSLSNTTRTSLVNTTVWADNTSNLLNTMLSVNNSYSNINYGLMQYTNINSYASSIYKASSLFMSV